MIAITKSWPLFTIFIVIFAFSFSFIGSEFQSLVITVPESWIESWYFAITFPFIKSESRSLVITIAESLKESWYLVILHFFFRPLWKSAFFRAGNVVGIGFHIFPLRLQIAFSRNVHMSLSLISSKMILTPLCSWIPVREGAATGTGLCYLKLKRENVTPNVTDYVSGSKYCRLPEWSKSTGTTYIRGYRIF